MYRIRVTVYHDEKTLALNKRALERVVDVADISTVNFPETTKALHFLYGDKAIINFNINVL